MPLDEVAPRGALSFGRGGPVTFGGGKKEEEEEEEEEDEGAAPANMPNTSSFKPPGEGAGGVGAGFDGGVLIFGTLPLLIVFCCGVIPSNMPKRPPPPPPPPPPPLDFGGESAPKISSRSPPSEPPLLPPPIPPLIPPKVEEAIGLSRGGVTSRFFFFFFVLPPILIP